MRARKAILAKVMAQRIADEHRKHKNLNWALIAAIKIVGELEAKGIIDK